MNPEIKAAWVAALRSGKYKQTTGVLFNGKAHCCLGVLCDISKQSGWNQEDTEYFSYLGEAEITPVEIVDWAGLDDRNPDVYADTSDDSSKKDLAGLNDSGYTFLEIADLIEEQL